MSEIPFNKTVAGRQLLDHQLPEFMKELGLLRHAMERIAVALESKADPLSKGGRTPRVERTDIRGDSPGSSSLPSPKGDSPCED